MYHLTKIMHKIYPLIEKTDFPKIARGELSTLQVNLGYKCNQRCLHCHVNAGPNRTEMMDKSTVNQVIDFAVKSHVKVVDLTGGAPELNKHFRYMIQALKFEGIHIIDRCNLTILNEKKMTNLANFLAENKVEIIASLPCYSEQNVDAQRGKGVFDVSIKVLLELNSLGYGLNHDLQLNLVYNPQGMVLPPNQSILEKDYKTFLAEKFNIKFNKLYTITNMPINRFGSMLVSKNKFHDYMNLLKSSFSKKAAENVMCKHLISIGHDGYVYDCDFNQMLELPLSNKKVHISQLALNSLKHLKIASADHCYGCTAGAGSSCGGSLT